MKQIRKKVLSLLMVLSLLFLCIGVNVKAVSYGSGTIKFGSTTGSTKVDSVSVTGKDDLENSWVITTVGTTSFTQNKDYSQLGSSKTPATSITLTMTVEENNGYFSNISAKFGGFNSTAGSISIKVGDNEVANGSLNGITDVIISQPESGDNSKVLGSTIAITITGIKKGVKLYNVSYNFSDTNVNILLSLDSNSSDCMIGKTNQLNAVCKNFNVDSPVVQYFTSDETIASISNEGLVTFKKMDEVLIYATALNETETITSNTLSIKVWPDNSKTLSIAEAKEICTFAGTSNSAFQYTIAGYVDGNAGASTKLTDTKGESSNFVAYKLTNYSALSAGDYIVATGYLVYYNSETPELVSGTYYGKYDVTFMADGKQYTIYEKIIEGTIEKPTDPTKEGYKFLGWYTDEELNDEFDFTSKVSSNLTLYAKFAEENSYADLLALNTKASLAVEYSTIINKINVYEGTKVTSLDELAIGDKIIIVNEDNKAVAGSLKQNYLNSTTAVFNNNKVTSLSTDAMIFTLGGTTDEWTLTNADGNKLGAASNKDIVMDSDVVTWKISFNNKKNAIITSTTEANGYIRYNSENPRFKTYASTSVNAVQIYKVELIETDSYSYEVSQVALRFGIIMPKELYDAVLSDDKLFGISLCKGDTFDSTKAVNIVNTNEVRTDKDGNTDENGEYYTFSVILTGMSLSDLDTNVIAKVFVYDFNTYSETENVVPLGYSIESSYSIKSLASYYLKMNNETINAHKGVLNYLSTYTEGE